MDWGKKMRTFLAAAVIFMGSAGTAFTADLADSSSVPNQTYYDWSGAYGGVLLGYGTGKTKAIGNPGFDGSAPDDRADLSPDGFVGGIVTGYNWQHGQWVFGAEGELGYLGAKDSLWYPDGDDYFANTKYGMYGSLTGRVGIAFDQNLFSVRGGVIASRIKYGFGDIDGGVNGNIDDDANVSGSDAAVGYTIGTSIEHAFANGWIGRIDYSFSDFGSHTETDLDGDDYDISNNMHMIRIGIIKKF